MVSRLRTNSCEFAQVVRGALRDFNPSTAGPQSYAFFLNYPSYYRAASGGIAQVTDITGLLSQEQKVFDEYKVSKLVVKYVSWVTAQVRVNTAVAFTAPSSPLLIWAADADDSAVWTTKAKALGAQGSAIKNRYFGGMHVFSQRQTDAVDRAKWLNLGAIIPSNSSPPDPNNPAKLSCLKVWIDAYQLANTTEGEFLVEWTVLFKGSYTLA